jgi:hypothetical protein
VCPLVIGAGVAKKGWFYLSTVHKSPHPQDIRLCTPGGNDCAKEQLMTNTTCIVSCKGLYADVEHANSVEENKNGQDVNNFHKLLADYNRFKEEFSENIVFNGNIYSKILCEYFPSVSSDKFIKSECFSLTINWSFPQYPRRSTSR